MNTIESWVKNERSFQYAPPTLYGRGCCHFNSTTINSILDTTMSTNNFAVYTKIGCPYCTKVTGALQLAEQRYVEYKLGRDFEKEGFYDEFGEGATFPQVSVDGKNLGGCAETVKYLRENNLV